MTVDKATLATACRTWGGKLWLPAAIDGPRLLWAISGCESSFGANVAPRQEPYYTQMAEAGTNTQLKALAERFGAAAAASSFGPWQELLCNCDASMTPDDFANVNRAAMEVTAFINRRILHGEGASTVEQIAAAYNSGKWQWLTLPPGVERYAAQSRHYYDTEALPA